MLFTLIGGIILSISIQVGLNMHLYDDIGDASSSLRGSTSSCRLRSYKKGCFFLLIDVIFDVEYESEIHFCRSPLFLEL